jgi:hypothetical protein
MGAFMRKSICVTRISSFIAVATAFLVTGPFHAFGQETQTTGSAKIAVGEYFDFDQPGVSERVGADIRYTRSVDGKGQFIEPLNRAGLGVLMTKRDLYKTCAAKVDDLAASRINLSLVKQPVYVCIRSSENRPGVLLLDPKKLQRPSRITIGFTLWERPRAKPAASPNNQIVSKIPDASSTDDKGDALFAPPIDPVAKSGGAGPKRETGGDRDKPPKAPPAPGDKPGANEPKGDQDKEPSSGRPVDIGDKPGAPGPKGGEEVDAEPTLTPAGPGDKPGAPGPKGETNADEDSTPFDLGGVSAQERRETFACPTPLQVNSMTAGHRSATTESGWKIEIDRPGTGIYGSAQSILYFTGARLSDNALTLICSYAYRASVRFNYGVNGRREARLASEAVQFDLRRGTGRACEPISGFDGQGVCKGTGTEWQGCPSVGDYFYNGGCTGYYKGADTCQVSCAEAFTPTD